VLHAQPMLSYTLCTCRYWTILHTHLSEAVLFMPKKFRT